MTTKTSQPATECSQCAELRRQLAILQENVDTNVNAAIGYGALALAAARAVGLDEDTMDNLPQVCAQMRRDVLRARDQARDSESALTLMLSKEWATECEGLKTRIAELDSQLADWRIGSLCSDCAPARMHHGGQYCRWCGKPLAGRANEERLPYSALKAQLAEAQGHETLLALALSDDPDELRQHIAKLEADLAAAQARAERAEQRLEQIGTALADALAVGDFSQAVLEALARVTDGDAE